MKFSRSNLFTKPKVKQSDPSAPVSNVTPITSPSALVARRFLRNRLALVGILILVLIFLFSFVGGFLTPYTESQVFESVSTTHRDIASVFTNDQYRFYSQNESVSSLFQSKLLLAIGKGENEFVFDGVNYKLNELFDDTYFITEGNLVKYVATVLIPDGNMENDFNFLVNALKAFSDGANTIEIENGRFQITYENGTLSVSNDSGEQLTLSQLTVQSLDPSFVISPTLRETILDAVLDGKEKITYNLGDTDEALDITYNGNEAKLKRTVTTSRILTFAPPSPSHWLGTDQNGMDILTRLIYGGRISLSIGFIVIAIEILIGIVLGGCAGYFGGIADSIIMRIVDIFNCIPTWPIIIIFGSLMDTQQVDPKIRIYYMMLILGILSWPGMARLIRGQILSLREQEFMIATEALGLSIPRRIFKHLIPNVIPQLIVMATMGLGSIILTESTLSFLGLGVKFPYASWGNIIQSVTSVYVMTNYPFVWIPAGFLILITVLGFNFIGDGLRDAFDPRMKR